MYNTVETMQYWNLWSTLHDACARAGLLAFSRQNYTWEYSDNKQKFKGLEHVVVTLSSETKCTSAEMQPPVDRVAMTIAMLLRRRNYLRFLPQCTRGLGRIKASRFVALLLYFLVYWWKTTGGSGTVQRSTSIDTGSPSLYTTTVL